MSSAVAERLAVNTQSCINFCMSILVLPTTLFSFFWLSFVTIKNKLFWNSLPLLLALINISLVWITDFIYYLSRFYYGVETEQLLRGESTSFGYLFKIEFCFTSCFLAPLSLYLYSWCFLPSLKAKDKECLEPWYHWFSIITMIIIPSCFYSLYFSYLFKIARYSASMYKGAY